MINMIVIHPKAVIPLPIHIKNGKGKGNSVKNQRTKKGKNQRRKRGEKRDTNRVRVKEEAEAAVDRDIGPRASIERIRKAKI